METPYKSKSRQTLSDINYWVSEAKNKFDVGDKVKAIVKSGREDSGDKIFKGEVISKGEYFIVVYFDGKYRRCFNWHDIHTGIVKFTY